MLDRRDIPFAHWQPRIGRDASAFGDIVSGVDDIEQCIRTIALTEKGSVPTQPEKCVSLQPYLDRRPSYAIPYIARELFDGLTLWEPRIVVAQVKITPEDFEHWRFPIFWYPRNDVLRDIRRTLIVLPEERRPGANANAA